MKRIDFIAIHCSATPADMDIGVPEITRWHKKRRFRTIGYHYVIRRDGTLETGRPETMRGAHEPKINARAISVCLVGGSPPPNSSEYRRGLGENNYTDEQWFQLVNIIQVLTDQYPDAQVIGHRDVPGVAKACPSFDVKPWWEKVSAYLKEHGAHPTEVIRG